MVGSRKKNPLADAETSPNKVTKIREAKKNERERERERETKPLPPSFGRTSSSRSSIPRVFIGRPSHLDSSLDLHLHLSLSLFPSFLSSSSSSSFSVWVAPWGRIGLWFSVGHEVGTGLLAGFSDRWVWEEVLSSTFFRDGTVVDRPLFGRR